jgi:photosystem II stability/assembly factor-like uncharacterized protein
VAVGGFPPDGGNAPIVVTTDGGQTWQKANSNTGAGNYLQSVSCVRGSTTCYAVGRNGTIVTTSDLGNWSTMASNATGMLNSVSCSSTTSCVATGQNGTVDVLSGTTWTATTGNAGGAYLAGVTCLNATTCTTVGRNGVTLATTNGTSWTQQAGGGTTASLNAVSCQAGACYAVGSVPAGGSGATLLRGAGGTWTAQVSHAPLALNSITCLDALQCFAGGSTGTVVTTTDGGVTWTQQGNPLSGPTSALNANNGATATNNVTINAAACTAGRCVFGTGADGDELTSPLVVVTVKAVTPYGAQSFSLPANSPALSVSPASEAANLQGTLTCTADTSHLGPGNTYAITGCNGLSDPGFSVVYDYANSSDQFQFPSAGGTVTGTVPATLALSLGSAATFGQFQPGVAKDYFAQTSATITSTAGDATLSVSDPDTVAPGHLVNGQFVLPQALQVAAVRTGGILAYNPLGASPLALLTYNGPVSNDGVTIGFKQSIGDHDALRTGNYGKTLTFTLSTTAP